MKLKYVFIMVILIAAISNVDAASTVYADSVGTYIATGDGSVDPYIYITSGTYYAEASCSGKVILINKTGTVGHFYACTYLNGVSQGSSKYYQDNCEDVSDITNGVCTWYFCPPQYVHSAQQYVGTGSGTYFKSHSYYYQYNTMSECSPYAFEKLVVTLYDAAPAEINGTVSCIDYVEKYDLFYFSSEWSEELIVNIKVVWAFYDNDESEDENRTGIQYFEPIFEIQAFIRGWKKAYKFHYRAKEYPDLALKLSQVCIVTSGSLEIEDHRYSDDHIHEFDLLYGVSGNCGCERCKNGD